MCRNGSGFKVEVVPPNLAWREAFATEAKQVIQALNGNIVAIHHIGSTAIPNIYAKPIIDILVEVQSIANVDKQQSQVEALNYETMGEYGIPDRRYFRKSNALGIRTHHLHIFEVGSAQITRHLTFRDYLISHPEDAQKYSDLKRQLARQHPDDIESYMDGKNDFIQAIDRKAAAWKNQIDESI